jgi:hypothetical protein
MRTQSQHPASRYFPQNRHNFPGFAVAFAFFVCHPSPQAEDLRLYLLLAD